MDKIYFISGIDTGIGKTMATGLLARSLRGRGVDAITVKLVQTGCAGFSEDLEEHRRIDGSGGFPEDAKGLTAPQIFAFPASPRLAAELEGETVDLKRIDSCIAECARNHEVVLVESAGGLDVPLDANTLSIDFAAGRGWPVILVTSGRLGAINHILLSLEAIRARRMRLAGIVQNCAPGTDPRIDRDAEATTNEYLAKWGFRCPLVRLAKVVGDEFPDIDVKEMFA